MPKIIKDLEKKLLNEARRQIEEKGYAAMTVRSVAEGCGVGVGTVYNYFSSKDELLATYILNDWNSCVLAVNTVAAYSEQPTAVFRCMYDQLNAFTDRHCGIFRDRAAAAAFANAYSEYHVLLRSQLADPLEKFCPDRFTAEFIAEAFLCWSMSNRSFEEINAIITRILP